MKRSEQPLGIVTSVVLSRSATKRAFTLIELIVVLVILGMLSSLAVLSVGNTMDRHRLSQAAETIEAFDVRLRREARQWRQPITATVNRATKTMTVPQADGRPRDFQLPSRVEIKSWQTARTSQGNRIGSGSPLQVVVSPDGRSPSYAVQLTSGKSTLWLVAFGGSGQIVVTDKSDQAKVWLTLLGTEK